jgi:hypothetical protein
MDYPYTSNIILTDVLFNEYGGDAELGTYGQRKASYYIAERQLSEDLETYLLPTIVTGTYLFVPTDKFLILDNSWVIRVIKTSFIDEKESVYWSQLGTNNIYISLMNPGRGIVDIHYLLGVCNCSHHTRYPYQIQEVYEAGFSSGTSYRPDILLALTTYSKVILNEIVGYGNESSGDIGVQSFSNQQYSETRVKLLRTSFGSSAEAQFVKKLVEKYHRKRWVAL